MIITDSVNILYIVNVPKNTNQISNILRLSKEPFEGINFGCDRTGIDFNSS